MKAVLKTAILSMCLAACGSSESASSTNGSNDPSSPPTSIQPQPIPDEGFAASFDPTKITVTTMVGGLAIGGVIKLPQGAGLSNVVGVAAFDATSPQAIAQATSDAAGAFSISLAGAAKGDRVFLFFPGDDALDTAFMIDTSSATGTPTVSALCLVADGSTSLQLSPSATGVVASLALTFSSACNQVIAIDGVRFVGDNDVALASPTSTFSIPLNGDSAAQSFSVTPLSAGAWVTYVVLSSGADRYVIVLRGTGN